MNQKFTEIKNRCKELEALMSDPAVSSDSKKLTEVSVEYAELKDSYDLVLKLEAVENGIKEAQEILSGNDNELKEMAQEELTNLKEKEITLNEQLTEALRPRDPKDSKNVIIEIRAGAGGDEAALFAAELARMYTRFAEKQGFKSAIISSNTTGTGGYKEVVMEIAGKGAYSQYKFESGVHRVQRVPETEKQGRVHTSTITVAVLAEAEEADIKIDPKDLRIDTYASGGAGGQSVNKTESAVRITHIPTGIVCQSQDQRSQQQNKAKAMQVLFSRIVAFQEEKINAEHSADRKAQVGTGDRSEKIRTYNFPQDRITDHRIKQNWSNIPAVMEGEMGSIVSALTTAALNNALGSGDDEE